MNRRKFLLTMGAGIAGSSFTTQKEGIATASPSDSEAVGHGAGPDRSPERHRRGVGDPQLHLPEDATSDRQITTTNTDREQFVLSGQLTGNFSSDVGQIRIGPPGEDLFTGILSNGSFSADVPRDEPLDVAYVQEAGSDGFITINDNPDIYYIERLSGLSEDRDLGTIEIPEGHLLDLKFENESGDPLNGITASVRSLDTDTDRWYEFYTETNDNGFYQTTNSPTGIEVAGEVQVAILADSEDSRIYDVDTVVDQFTVTESRFETITVDPITVSGKFTRPNGAPVVGDDVVVYVDSDDSAEAVTDDGGKFEFQLPERDDSVSGAYQIQYYRSGLVNTDEIAEGTWVEMHAGPQLDGSINEDLGSIELPEGELVQVRTLDETGNPVENATVRYIHRNQIQNSTAGAYFFTDETGLGVSYTDERSGIRLSGTVDIRAYPPDIDRLADTTVERTITVGEPMTVGIEFPAGDGSSIGEYADDEGVIRTDGLLQAIEDWRSGETDTDTLLSVIEAWRSGESVE